MPLYNNLFNLLPLPAWVYHEESFHIIDVNESAIQHYGYSKEEFLGLTIKALRPENEIPLLLKAHANFIEKDGNIPLGTFTHIKKNGESIRVKINGRKVVFEGQKAVMVICEDITDHEIWLNKIKVSEERLIAATSIAKLGYWKTDLATGALGWTDEIFNIWGRNKNDFELNYEAFMASVHPLDIDRFCKAQQRSIELDDDLNIDHRILLPDGSVKWVQERGRVLRDREGNPIYFEGTVQDISAKKMEEERLKLLESVITHTNDAVLITEAEPFDEPGPRIMYVNEAFTKMTGYTAEEVIGKTPRILQGPNSDKEELKRLSNALRNWESCQISTINYKKNGEEFWINFTVNPVMDERGWYTHWIAIERDITEQKEIELEKELLSKISINFSIEMDLVAAAKSICTTVSEFGKFDLVEIWNVNVERTQIQLLAYQSCEQVQDLLYHSSSIQSLQPLEGIAGKVWINQEQLLLTNLNSNDFFVWKHPFLKTSHEAILGIPLFYNHEVLSVMLIGSLQGANHLKKYTNVFKQLEGFIGSEINRKKLENDLNHLYEAIPDILCTMDLQGRFLKMNKAGCTLLNYTEQEMLFEYADVFIYEDDRVLTQEVIKTLCESQNTVKFENRYFSKSGEIIWLSWTCNSSLQEGIIYATAKNITEEKKLRELNRLANSLARIGSWEIDVSKEKIYWSDMVHELHETDPNSFIPNLETGIHFYREEFRPFVESTIQQSMETGKPFDFEAIIITATNKERWIRAIGNSEMMNGQCKRIYGSFQDIHDRKEAEVRLQSLADNLPGVVFQYYVFPDGTDCLKNVTHDSQLIWGYSAEEVMEDNQVVWDGITKAGDKEKVAESVAHSIKNRSKWNVSWRYVMPNGEVKTHLGHGIPNFLSDGSVVYNGLVLDITHQTQNEELLKESTEMAKIGSWELNLINQNGDAMYWSPMTKKILEVDDQYNPSLTGGFEFYVQESKERIQQKVQALIENGAEFDEELLLVTNKGHHKWVRSIGKSTRVNNKCIKIYGSFQDIDAPKKMEQQIREILGSISEAFYAVDKDWNFTYFNKEAESLLLKKEREVIGQNIWEVFPAAKNTLLQEVFERVVATGKSESIDYFFPGDDKWYELNAYPSLGGVSAYFKNIDERKQAAEQLKASFEEKNTILESIGDAFFSVTKDWIVTYWNREAEYILGKKREEVVGKNLWEAYPDALNTDFEHQYLKAMETQKNVSFEAHYPMMNIWFEVSAYPSSTGLSVYFKDVTLRKQADIQLVEANERFEKVTEATNDAIWDWDLVNKTFYRSNGIEKFFGAHTSKSLNQNDFWKDSFHPEDLPKIVASIEKAIDDPECHRWEMEYIIYNEQKQKVFVIDRGLILRDKNGKATRMVGAMTDITERKNHENQLIHLNDSIKQYAHELELTNEELEQFAFIASHDLQEPLRMISSFLDQLKRKYGHQLDDKAHQYIHFATDGAKRMKQIILDLLEYSRAGKLPNTAEEVNLYHVLDQYQLLRSKVISERKVAINIGSLPTLLSYNAPLTQTIHCLLDNAIKYCPQDRSPKIDISSESFENCWMFRVKDNGIGIDPTFFEKIFIMFQRLHNRDQYAGNGIGLSIAKKHVESWGGKIWLESEPDKGSIFYFTHPKQIN